MTTVEDVGIEEEEIVLLYYKYQPVPDVSALIADQTELCQLLGLVSNFDFSSTSYFRIRTQSKLLS